MSQEKNIRLTKFELEIMDVLWGLKTASIREIHEGLPKENRPAYTTVQTIINRLEEKQAVSRIKKIGNAHIFEPNIKQTSAYHRLIDELLKALGGNIEPLMSYLIESGKITLANIKELEEALVKLENTKEEVSKETSLETSETYFKNTASQSFDLTQD